MKKKAVKIVLTGLAIIVILFWGNICCHNKILNINKMQKQEKEVAQEEISDMMTDEELEYMFREGIEWTPREDDLYWQWAQDTLKGMITDEVCIDFVERDEAHELYSDEWYRGSRLSEPFLYVYICKMYYKVNTDPQDADMIFFHMDSPRRAGEDDGEFMFFVWVKKTEHGVELGTDFSQKLFRHILWECSVKSYEENGSYLIGLFPSEQWMEYCPLYDLLGEDMVMVSDTDKEELEAVFQDACEKMRVWQEKVAGDLSQKIRFGVSFDTYAFNHYRQEKAAEDFENPYWYQHYMTYCDEQMNIKGYSKWMEAYCTYYPEYRLDFHTGYDSEKKAIFQAMCADREAYLKSEQEKVQEVETAAESETYVIKEGDCLWKVAERYYGDGMYWNRIYEENKETIGEDANSIFPGQVFGLPKRN